jgi:hypothetical protein
MDEMPLHASPPRCASNLSRATLRASSAKLRTAALVARSPGHAQRCHRHVPGGHEDQARPLVQLSGGTMPCDGGWPVDRVEVFKRWTESGFQP